MGKWLQKGVGYVSAGMALVSTSAFAAVPESVTTALTEGKADTIAVAGLAIAIVVAVAAFRYMRSAVK